MAIGAIELATVTRVQDYTTMKQNEDNKGFIDQSAIGHQVQKNEEQKMRDVHDSENADFHNRQFDARDKGDNEYQGDGGRNRRKKQPMERVIVNGHESFDMKI